KTTDCGKRTKHLLKFHAQLAIIQFRRRYHFDSALDKTIKIRVIRSPLPCAGALQENFLEFWWHVSHAATDHRHRLAPPARVSSSRYEFRDRHWLHSRASDQMQTWLQE